MSQKLWERKRDTEIGAETLPQKKINVVSCQKLCEPKTEMCGHDFPHNTPQYLL